MPLFHLRPISRAIANRVVHEFAMDLNKALTGANISKAGADGHWRDDGWPGPAFGGVDERTPVRVNRDPTKRPDRRGLERPGGRRHRASEPKGASPLEATLAQAPADAGHEEAARAAFKAAAPEEWISIGARSYERVAEDRDGCALYAEPGSNRQGTLVKRDRTGALGTWRANNLAAPHGGFWRWL